MKPGRLKLGRPTIKDPGRAYVSFLIPLIDLTEFDRFRGIVKLESEVLGRKVSVAEVMREFIYNYGR